MILNYFYRYAGIILITEHKLPISQSKTPDLHSNPERGSGGVTPDALVGLRQCAHKAAQ